MNTHNELNNLWQQMRDAIDAAYKAATPGAFDGNALRDYARDISWEDNLAALVGRESANERQHRQNRTSPRGFSVGDAANLIVMNCVSRGSDLKELPPSTHFLVYRQTAVEAEVVGFLARKHISKTWKDAVGKFDYSELMKAS